MPTCNASARISTAKRPPPSSALLPQAPSSVPLPPMNPLPSSSSSKSSPPAKIPANKSKANQGRFKNISYLCTHKALVAKLVDAPDLGSGVARRVGSSPIRRTIQNPNCLILSGWDFCFYVFGNILATYFDANLLWLLKAESFSHSFTQF